MVLSQFALFIALLVLLGIAVKIPLPFKRKKLIRVGIVSFTVLMLAASIDIPFLPQGAVTGLAQVRQSTSDGGWISNFLNSLNNYFNTPIDKTTVDINQPLAEQQIQNREAAVDSFMKEYNIPREKRQELLQQAQDLQTTPKQQQESLQQCFERVIVECT